MKDEQLFLKIHLLWVKEKNSLYSSPPSADTKKQQASSLFPLVELDCTTSPPTSWLVLENGPGLLLKLMEWQSAQPMVMTTTVQVKMPRLSAVVWLSWMKVHTFIRKIPQVCKFVGEQANVCAIWQCFCVCFPFLATFEPCVINFQVMKFLWNTSLGVMQHLLWRAHLMSLDSHDSESKKSVDELHHVCNIAHKLDVHRSMHPLAVDGDDDSWVPDKIDSNWFQLTVMKHLEKIQT